uniref:Uncharacterized protein n=1 Tax=Ananas comosus var. bracteatus TaxID=296719 RepID=A0A6V7NV54_ANACO|nr:unnamed protein product [Ananas comosus var. bracteatus]
MDLRGVPPWHPERVRADEKQAKKKTKRKQWDHGNGETAHSSAPLDSGKEWPCPPQPDPKPSPETWADLAAAAAAPPPQKPPPSAEELARAAATLAQYNGVKVSRSFFCKRKHDDDDEEQDAEEDDDDDDRDVDEDESGQSGTSFKFFLEIFESDGALRQYYERNCERGDFACLVCEGIGKKGKRFGSCVGLVQHSNSISKTRRRGAHRAFARAVCRVLGWDMKRLPSIVLDAGNSLGQSLAKAANAKEGTEKKDSSSQEEVSGNKEEIPKEVTNEEGCHEDSTNFVETKESTEQHNKEVSDNKEELSNDLAEDLKTSKGDQISDLLKEN